MLKAGKLTVIGRWVVGIATTLLTAFLGGAVAWGIGVQARVSVLEYRSERAADTSVVAEVDRIRVQLEQAVAHLEGEIRRLDDLRVDNDARVQDGLGRIEKNQAYIITTLKGSVRQCDGSPD